MSHLIARFVDAEFALDAAPPSVEVSSNPDFGVVILTAQTIGDEEDEGPIAPVVFNRSEFASFVGGILANADSALRTEIEIAAGIITAKRRG